MIHDWRILQWGDIASLEYGKGLRSNQRLVGKFPVYGTNGKIGYCNSTVCDKDGIIIGRKGAYREVHYSAVPFFVIDTAFYIKKKEFFDTKWAYYNLKTYNINDLDSGSAIPSTSREDFYRLPVLVPPLPEQRAIASVLSSLDDKIDLLRRQNETLEAMAQALFRQWFVVEAKDEWEEKTIGDVVEIKGGATPNTNISDYWDGDIYWTTPKDLSGLESVFMFNTVRKITVSGLEKISSGLLPRGTVLLSSRAPIGYLAITDIEVAINQGYIAIFENNIISNYYMYLWCKSNMEGIIAAANGATFLEISKSVFRTLPFLLPPRKLLSDFNDRISPIFHKIRTNQTQIHTLEKLRDTLLPKLMSGEVRVKY